MKYKINDMVRFNMANINLNEIGEDYRNFILENKDVSFNIIGITASPYFPYVVMSSRVFKENELEFFSVNKRM